MKKLVLTILVLLGLKIQAQVNLCESLMVMGSQFQLTIQMDHDEEMIFIDHWITTASNECILGEDSVSASHHIYNFLTPYDTITTCITHGVLTNNPYTCCVEWIWDGEEWINVEIVMAIKEPDFNVNLDNKIYDLTGRELLDIPRGTAYIKNGRKFIKQ